jgi:hypothetical protein
MLEAGPAGERSRIARSGRGRGGFRKRRRRHVRHFAAYGGVAHHGGVAPCLRTLSHRHVAITLEPVASDARVAGLTRLTCYRKARGVGLRILAPEPPPPAPHFVQLSASDPTVAEVMTILGAERTLGWVDLYKVFEIIEHDVGGRRVLVKKGWTTSRQAENFTLSANRKDVSGESARHARNRGLPPDPSRAMTLEHGLEWVRTVTNRWLESRLNP